MLLAGLAFAMAVNCCDGGSGLIKQEIVNEAPKVEVIEVVEVVEVVEAPTFAIAPVSEGFKTYSLYGRTPPVEWQRYLYSELEQKGFAWFMPYAMCQIQQESCWNQWSDNGHDKGLTQQKGIYWDNRATHFGIPGADIWDPYAQLHVYSCMMCNFLLATGGNVEKALSLYFLGYDGYSEFYVNCVMSHMEVLE